MLIGVYKFSIHTHRDWILNRVILTQSGTPPTNNFLAEVLLVRSSGRLLWRTFRKSGIPSAFAKATFTMWWPPVETFTNLPKLREWKKVKPIYTKWSNLFALVKVQQNENGDDRKRESHLAGSIRTSVTMIVMFTTHCLFAFRLIC